jgi:hypothetical protein
VKRPGAHALPGRDEMRLIKHPRVLDKAEARHRQSPLLSTLRLPALVEQLVEQGFCVSGPLGL